MYLVYKTDNLHSFASRDVIGVCSTKNLALGICGKNARKEGEKLTPDQLFNLFNLDQTQGYSGDGEFHIEKVKANQLL